MYFKMVPIKPRKLKVIDEGRFRIEARKALGNVREFGFSQFQKTTATWSNRPNFSKVGPVTVTDGVKVEVYTESLIYLFVDVGTRPHPIFPRYAPRLKFQTKYRAKTVPRKIGSRRGGASGPFVTAKAVRHPGTEGRFFGGIIAGQVRRKLEAAIIKAQRTAGISSGT